MKTYQEYLQYCEEFNANNGKVSRNEVDFTKPGYYIFSEDKQKYVFSTGSYDTAAMLNCDGVYHIYVSPTELVVNPF